MLFLQETLHIICDHGNGVMNGAWGTVFAPVRTEGAHGTDVYVFEDLDDVVQCDLVRRTSKPITAVWACGTGCNAVQG